jgi:hypothetical protein
MVVAVAERRFGLALRVAARSSRGVTTAPWPGPGDSEAPVDPEGWTPSWHEAYAQVLTEPDGNGRADESLPASTDPWPGPGDSEGARP